MSTKDTIQSIQKYQKNLILRAKKEIAVKTEALKKAQEMHKLTKKEYQKLYNEHVAMKNNFKNMKNILSLSRSKKGEKKGKILNAKRKKLQSINVRKKRILTL